MCEIKQQPGILFWSAWQVAYVKNECETGLGFFNDSSVFFKINLSTTTLYVIEVDKVIPKFQFSKVNRWANECDQTRIL